jgi:hypothetical protein
MFGLLKFHTSGSRWQFGCFVFGCFLMFGVQLQGFRFQVKGSQINQEKKLLACTAVMSLLFPVGTKRGSSQGPTGFGAYMPPHKHDPGLPTINDEAYALSHTRIKIGAIPGYRDLIIHKRRQYLWPGIAKVKCPKSPFTH